MENILTTILQKSFIANATKNAFCCDHTYYTYGQMYTIIQSVRSVIKTQIPIDDRKVGLVTYNLSTPEVYASIIALWMEGKAYIPLHPDFPDSRNVDSIQEAGLQYVLDTGGRSENWPVTSISLNGLEISDENSDGVVSLQDDDLAYIFFTSGTTGKPKGVPITFGNLSAFIAAFNDLGYELSVKDRCLQMFELTFDLSVMSYLVSFLVGACMYPIPSGVMKYSYIYEVLEDHKLTFALLVPSILQYLKPYYNEIKCPHLKYNLFAGEALPLDVLEQWSHCVPNAQIDNVYGPTEHTIICTRYTYQRNSPNNAYNGILNIGEPMTGTRVMLVDDNNIEVPDGDSGELCLAGAQQTPGYWNNPTHNTERFFEVASSGIKKRFYRTGDICKINANGEIIYIGRKDFQVQIQGFRVELPEIELAVRSIMQDKNSAVVAFTSTLQTMAIGLMIEGPSFDTEDLLIRLRNKLPAYMIPSEVQFIPQLPLNTNGKTDRNKITSRFENLT